MIGRVDEFKKDNDDDGNDGNENDDGDVARMRTN